MKETFSGFGYLNQDKLLLSTETAIKTFYTGQKQNKTSSRLQYIRNNNIIEYKSDDYKSQHNNHQ